MHETYRMLGREHEADLEREVTRRHLAAGVGDRRDPAADEARQRPGSRRYASFLVRLLAPVREQTVDADGKLK